METIGPPHAFETNSTPSRAMQINPGYPAFDTRLPAARIRPRRGITLLIRNALNIETAYEVHQNGWAATGRCNTNRGIAGQRVVIAASSP
jgi:hypothetical protein